jgi:hypothetical protein
VENIAMEATSILSETAKKTRGVRMETLHRNDLPQKLKPIAMDLR